MSLEINPINSTNSRPKKRILFIITQLELGGAQRFLYNLLTHIHDRYEIVVVTGSDGGEKLTDNIQSLNVKTLILEGLKREISPSHDLRACFEIKNLLNKFNPDSLFLLSSKAGFIGSLASKLSIHGQSIKVIYRIGGWTFNDPWPSWKKKLWVKLEKLSAAWKDIIIVNNRHDFEQAQKLLIKPREKMVLIHNGIDIYKMDFLEREEARLKLFERIAKHSDKIFPALEGRGSPNEVGRQTETIIGTVANLYPSKGIDVLLETAEYFKNNDGVSFFIIGDGPERSKISKLIKDMGLEKKVFLFGQIPDARRYITAFDLFVLPSVKEGFPFALIEALAAKLPVIATRVGSVPEVIENSKNGFIVEPGNPAALAGKIKELLANNRLRQEFSIQGHQTVLFNFSEDKMVKEIEALL